MEELDKEYADSVYFLFVYSREAHLGEHSPADTSIEQKVLQAKMLGAKDDAAHGC